MKATIPFCCTGRYVVAAILMVPVCAAAQDMPVAVAPPDVAPPGPLSPTPGSMPVTAAPATSSGALPQAQDYELEKSRQQLTRLRFEVGLDGNFTVAGRLGNFGFGSYVRLGAQFRPWIDTQAELAAGTLIFSSYVRGAFTVGFTPVRWFTVSIGPVVGYLGGSGITGSPTFGTGYAGGTVRTDFHVAQLRTARGRRHSFTLGVAADLGSAFGNYGPYQNSGTALGTMVNIGYSMH